MRLSLTDHPAKASLVTGGLQADAFFTISADGARLAYTRAVAYSNLWSAELSARGPGGKATPHSLTSGTLLQSDVSFSPDQQWVALTIGAEGNRSLYKAAATGGQPMQLTFFENSDVSSPAWSPDGHRIAFICSQGGAAKVWLVNADGTEAHPLEKTNASGTNGALAWFPSSKIVYQKRGLHNFVLLNPDTQEESQLLARDLEGWLPYATVISPDGKSVAAWWNDRTKADAHVGVGVFSPPDPAGRFILFGYCFPLGWSRDGRFVYATSGGDQREIVQLEVANPKTPKTVAAMPGPINSATVSADGKKIIAAVNESKSDVWIMENFDPTSVQRPRP